jgi:hypothetical protein
MVKNGLRCLHNFKYIFTVKIIESDAKVDNREIGQLFQGNGPHTGYYTMSKDGNSLTALWKGDVTSVLAADCSPRTSFKGTWEYHGNFTSKTTYSVGWIGEYSFN